MYRIGEDLSRVASRVVGDEHRTHERVRADRCPYTVVSRQDGDMARWGSSHGYLDRFPRWLSPRQQPEASDQRRTALGIKKGDPLL
jgi:hypothetical protein